MAIEEIVNSPKSPKELAKRLDIGFNISLATPRYHFELNSGGFYVKPDLVMIFKLLKLAKQNVGGSHDPFTDLLGLVADRGKFWKPTVEWMQDVPTYLRDQHALWAQWISLKELMIINGFNFRSLMEDKYLQFLLNYLNENIPELKSMSTIDIEKVEKAIGERYRYVRIKPLETRLSIEEKLEIQGLAIDSEKFLTASVVNSDSLIKEGGTVKEYQQYIINMVYQPIIRLAFSTLINESDVQMQVQSFRKIRLEALQNAIFAYTEDLISKERFEWAIKQIEKFTGIMSHKPHYEGLIMTIKGRYGSPEEKLYQKLYQEATEHLSGGKKPSKVVRPF
ncbi:hypothetical protein HYW99_01475 [Candidatus Woesearchaeota archaeon]|nr:hypothetical protein [Candidatus Woesearchaeota archaeon]